MSSRHYAAEDYQSAVKEKRLITEGEIAEHGMHAPGSFSRILYQV
jgi:hypothetical protein